MATPRIDDELWTIIEPLIPVKPRRFMHPGRRPRDARACLNGILFVLFTGIQWEHLPREFGCCGMTCWRRLRDWRQAGVWERLHRLLLDRLRAADAIDWSRAIVDSASLRAVGGGELTGRNPTDRGKFGSKHHLIVDAQGLPLATLLTAANVPDVTQLLELVEAIPPIAGKPGAPRRRSDAVQGDAGYRSLRHRINLFVRGITRIISERSGVHGSGLGRTRWVVERTLAWLRQFRRLRVRYDRRADIHRGFLTLACARICWRHAINSFC